MKSSTGVSLKLDAAEFFRDSAFVEWLNNGQPKMTWHIGGNPGDWSDVVVLVDPGLTGEGTDSDMPEHIWDKIVAECKKHFAHSVARNGNHIPVWLVNSECEAYDVQEQEV